MALAKAGGTYDAYIGDTPLRLPRTLPRPVGISKRPAPSARTPQTWKSFVAGASLSMRCVRASGDWVFAPLASLGLCDHAFSPADRAAENDASRRSPSHDDLKRERYIRDAAADILTDRGHRTSIQSGSVGARHTWERT